MFSRVRIPCENTSIEKSCLTSEVNSIFIIKSIEFSVNYVFLFFLKHVSFKSQTLHAIYDMTSEFITYFHNVKITDNFTE